VRLCSLFCAFININNIIYLLLSIPVVIKKYYSILDTILYKIIK